jgi:hypothetical protein
MDCREACHGSYGPDGPASRIRRAVPARYPPATPSPVHLSSFPALFYADGHIMSLT